MRVFVAGASGAIGTRLVPQLIDRGHEVTGTSRSPATPSASGRSAPSRSCSTCSTRAPSAPAVLEAEPDAIVHQATALADVRFSKHLDRSFAQTNRLRTEGTDALLAAAREAGVRRFVAQSFASSRLRARGRAGQDRGRSARPDPVPAMRETDAAMRHLDEVVTDAGGIVLRYGGFYGAANDGLVEPVRKRQFPIVGDGAACPRSSTSTTPPRRPCSRSSTTPRHLQRRRRRARPGARVAAGARQALGAKPPRHVPRWLGAAVRRRGPGDDGDRVARRLEREGQARARLGAALPELARGLPGRLRDLVATDRGAMRPAANASHVTR